VAAGLSLRQHRLKTCATKKYSPSPGRVSNGPAFFVFPPKT
jgi:hypothetical protein